MGAISGVNVPFADGIDPLRRKLRYTGSTLYYILPAVRFNPFIYPSPSVYLVKMWAQCRGQGSRWILSPPSPLVTTVDVSALYYALPAICFHPPLYYSLPLSLTLFLYVPVSLIYPWAKFWGYKVPFRGGTGPLRWKPHWMGSTLNYVPSGAFFHPSFSTLFSGLSYIIL